ncbi:MAG TPA: LysR substrate-binding domain-containing protein [Gammaproteobacteria bacterium]|nr:LysR substrate-binding domain-containing protein [Gammaproteobacteria bacterium]
MMELSDLRVFCCVVDAGGITRAAERLHRVPSNVTTRVRQLEADLGVRLFLREGRRLRISPAGQLLRGYAERLLTLADEARAALQDRTPRGSLRLGSMESTAAIRLPDPLAAFHRAYPEVEIELRTGPTRELLAGALSGALDAALVADAPDDPRLEGPAVFEEELVVIAAAGHPPIRAPGDVRLRSVLAFAAGCAYRRRLEEWLRAGGVIPGQVVELASYHAILGCAVAGMGIALVPREVLELFPARAGLSVHALSGDDGRAGTRLVWRRGGASNAVQALSALLLAGAGVAS